MDSLIQKSKDYLKRRRNNYIVYRRHVSVKTGVTEEIIHKRMNIAIDKEEIAPKHFAVCDFYGVETCFYWDADKLVIFPYTKDSNSTPLRILSTPAPVRKVQFFDSRAFLICAPQGIYKLSRTGEFALLSKNALDMGVNSFSF